MPVSFIALGACLAAVAFVASMLGIGGGVSFTPVQMLFGIGIHESAATSLFLISVLSLSATAVYHRAGKVDWRLAFVLVMFTASGGMGGGYLASFIRGDVLAVMLLAVMVFVGISMTRRRVALPSPGVPRKTWYLWKRTRCGEAYSINLLLAIPISLAAGMLSGLVGIGGGVLQVPMMVLLFDIPMDIAIATSGFMVGLTAIGGLAGHAVAGHWDWRMSLVFAPGVFAGARLGAHVMLRVDKLKLKLIFGVFMFLLAAMLTVKLLTG